MGTGRVTAILTILALGEAAAISATVIDDSPVHGQAAIATSAEVLYHN